MSNPSENEETPTTPHSYAERSSCALVYYAAERTLMAWLRAALGMMALGFVIDRFGLVLRMMPTRAGIGEHPTVYSFWAGSALVLGGAALALVAAVRYIGIELRFRREGCGAPGHGLPLGILFTLFVAAVGIAITFILATIRY